MSLMLSKKMTTGGKLRLILWKNYLLQKRHYFQTFFDIFLPVIVFIFYVLLYKYTSDSSDPRSHAINTYESQSIDSLDPHLWYVQHFTNILVLVFVLVDFCIVYIGKSSPKLCFLLFSK